MKDCIETVKVIGITEKHLRGPTFWKFILLSILNGVPNMQLIRHFIPCKSCKDNFEKHLTNFTGDSEKRITMVYNEIRMQQGQKHNWTIDELYEKYLGDEIIEQSQVYHDNVKDK